MDFFKSSYQKFQVPKMEESWISHTDYIGEDSSILGTWNVWCKFSLPEWLQGGFHGEADIAIAVNFLGEC